MTAKDGADTRTVPATDHGALFFGATKEKDEDCSLHRLERKAIEVEAELKRIHAKIHHLRSKERRITGDNDNTPIHIVGSCLIDIISFLDPKSAAQCEMTSIAMKKAARSAWPNIENNICPMKEHRSEATSIKERCVRHFVASRFAREVESNITRRKGSNNFRKNIQAHASYLPSHGYIGQEEHYEIFVRLGDGQLGVGSGNKMDILGPDNIVLSQGFNNDSFTNRFYQPECDYEQRGGNVFMNLVLNLRLGWEHVFPHMPNDFCSSKEKCVYHPEFDEMHRFAHHLLVTVVAVHRETHKAYLMYTTWGFEEDKGWEGSMYCFEGTWMQTEQGSGETCVLSLQADTFEYDDDMDCIPYFRLELVYYCPREEYSYGRRRYTCGDKELESATFTKKISHGLRIESDFLTQEDLNNEPECEDYIPLFELFEPVGDTFDVF